MIYQPLLCLSLRLVTPDLGRYLLSFKIQKSPTSWINCCKSMSTWKQTVFVSPGSTSQLLHVANLRLTNTFQSCLINHLINSYNSPTGEHCMMACLLIASVDLVVHCLFPYNLITFIKSRGDEITHLLTKTTQVHSQPKCNKLSERELRSGIGPCRQKNEAIRAGIHWPIRLAWFFQ